MKKIILTFLFSVTICFSTQLFAQSDYRLYENSNDAFFYSDKTISEQRFEISNPQLPALPRVASEENQHAPIGSGTILLTSLGIGYLTLKKKKRKE